MSLSLDVEGHGLLEGRWVPFLFIAHADLVNWADFCHDQMVSREEYRRLEGLRVVHSETGAVLGQFLREERMGDDPGRSLQAD